MSENLPTPATREEEFLYKMAQGETDLPEPITNKEKYLAEIAKNGGGGSGLPAVTSDDNGKVLKVINGAWDKGTESGGGNDFLVEFTITPGSGDDPTTVTTQTSVDAIIAAINAGKIVRCKAVKRIDLGEDIYIQNVMLGSACTHADMTTVNGQNLVLFDVYDFDSEHVMSWRSSTIAGGYIVQEGEQSEDIWTLISWQKD